MYETLTDHVTKISGQYQSGKAVSGHGCYITSEGHILTSIADVDKTNRLFVTTPYHPWPVPAKIVHHFSEADLAILQALYEPPCLFPTVMLDRREFKDLSRGTTFETFRLGLADELETIKWRRIRPAVSFDHESSRIILDCQAVLSNRGAPGFDRDGRLTGIVLSRPRRPEDRTELIPTFRIRELIAEAELGPPLAALGAISHPRRNNGDLRDSARALEPRIVHPLPPAPRFVGRTAELTQLRSFWESPLPGLLTLVGLGGAGKTALVEQLLRELGSGDLTPCDGLFVWSFYEDSDAIAFLKAAYEYFSQSSINEAKGYAVLPLLEEVLKDGKRHLLVLDGLERVQFERSSERHEYGELEDSYLKALLLRIAYGIGSTKTIITTRFPVADLLKWPIRYNTCIDVNVIDRDSAISLLQRNGVEGSMGRLDDLLEKFGSHALTLDHLGSYLHHFRDGNPDLAPVSKLLSGADKQARQLASIFRAYENDLRIREIHTLSSLSLFRYSVDFTSLLVLSNAITEHFYGSRPEYQLSKVQLAESLYLLREYHLILCEANNRFTVHPAVRDYFSKKVANPAGAHKALSDHYAQLSRRPGTEYASDNETLRLLEELIYHLIRAGMIKDAKHIYNSRLGGSYRLGYILGEYARGKRILESFSDPLTVDPDGWLKYLRGVGDLVMAEQLWNDSEVRSSVSFFSAHGFDDIRLLRGALVGVGSTATDYLMGLRDRVDTSLETAPRYMALLRSKYYSGFNSNLQGNAAAGALLTAESCRCAGKLEQSHAFIEDASRWIMRTGSPEHIFLVFYMKSRVYFDEGKYTDAENAINEGLFLARICGFGIFYIDALLERSKLYIQMSRFAIAVQDATEARTLAEARHCKYVWAAADAGMLLGKALFQLGDVRKAAAALTKALVIMAKLPHPYTEEARSLLRRCKA